MPLPSNSEQSSRLPGGPGGHSTIQLPPHLSKLRRLSSSLLSRKPPLTLSIMQAPSQALVLPLLPRASFPWHGPGLLPPFFQAPAHRCAGAAFPATQKSLPSTSLHCSRTWIQAPPMRGWGGAYGRLPLRRQLCEREALALFQAVCSPRTQGFSHTRDMCPFMWGR